MLQCVRLQDRLTMVKMSTAAHLESYSVLAQALTAPVPLPERLQRALQALQRILPFGLARVVILGEHPWSYTFPGDSEASSTSPSPTWPHAWTLSLLKRRKPAAHCIKYGLHYYGWPIVWSESIFGALELLLPSEDPDMLEDPVVEAGLPLFASAIAATLGSHTLPVVSDKPYDSVIALDELRQRLEAPLRLQPLVQHVLQWVQRYTPAVTASLHLQRWNRDEPGWLTFALPPNTELPMTGRAAGSEPQMVSSAVLHVAGQTLTAGRPLWRRNRHGFELGVPLRAGEDTLGTLVVAGRRFDRAHLQLITQSGPVIGGALQRAEFYQRLMEANQHLRQVFDGLPTGLALLDNEGRLLRANPAWPRLWGLPSQSVQQGQEVPWDMFEPILTRIPDPLAFDAFFRRWNNDTRETSFRLQQPHQELHLLAVPVYDTLGLRPGYLLAANDVTRDRELDRLKSEFVSVVSHELRTPLTSILGYTELLQAREFPPQERRELIETVWKQATHLSSLVEDLLNVSRIDAGRITLTRWVLSLSQIVRELTAQLNKTLDQSRHRLLIDVSERLPSVYADRDRLRQILGNLLSNAIKYSPEGGEIVLRAEVWQGQPSATPALPTEPTMLISVRDPGIGISTDELSRIFERFYRVDNSNTRKIGGSGLGLSITQALVELHGGRIWAESTPGQGSTFFFTLPLATDGNFLQNTTP